MYVSARTLDELELVLDREKFDRYLDRPSRSEFVAVIRCHVHLFAVKSPDLEAVAPSCRDPKDNQFLALAFVAEADVLVSSDEDLLVMHPWREITIMTPGDFFSRLQEKSEPLQRR